MFQIVVISPNFTSGACSNDFLLPELVSINLCGDEVMADKPFALVVSMNPPHTGYSMFPKRYLEHYEHLTTDELCIRPNIPAADTNMGRSYRRDIRNYFAMITGAGAVYNSLAG